jgi:hypothetical protein
MVMVQGVGFRYLEALPASISGVTRRVRDKEGERKDWAMVLVGMGGGKIECADG